MMHELLLVLALAVPGAAAAVETLGTITILEGPAFVYRGNGRLHAAEGVRLAPGDIVETAPAAMAQIELADRSVLQFGPATRVLIDRSMYVMDGWIKRIGAKTAADAAQGFVLRSAQFEIEPAAATIVLHATASTLDLFVENGEQRIGERAAAGSDASLVSLTAGRFYQRKAGARGVVAAMPPPAFVNALPRAFRDPLPRRIDQFAQREVQPKEAPAFTYADVQPWLQAEVPLRKPLMQRWRDKAKEPPFRTALVANLRAHPEWAPVLWPERYKPKPRPPAPITPLARPAPTTAPAAAPTPVTATVPASVPTVATVVTDAPSPSAPAPAQ